MSVARPPIPDDLDGVLSPTFLTAALGERFPDIDVVAVTPGPVVSRVSTNARFSIECAKGVPEGLSPHLCVKGYFGEWGALARTAGVPEAGFYRDLAGTIGVRTLRAHYADVDADGRNIIITEDVVVDGATFLAALSPYTPDQAARSLEQLATLHATTWCRDVDALSYLRPRLARTLEARGVKEISGNFDGPIGAGVPVEVRDPQQLVDAYRLLAALAADAEPWCVVHGDAHIGNVFLAADGTPSFLDWQLVQRAAWWIDVGYHVSSALTIDDRRRTERDLLAHYLDALAAAGVDAPKGDDAWIAYRRGIVHGFLLWGITLRVAPPITTELLTRLGTAVADHDSFSLLA